MGRRAPGIAYEAASNRKRKETYTDGVGREALALDLHDPLATLPHLTHLALSGCALLGDGALVCIAEGLPSLKSLLLTESAGFADAVCPPPQPPYLHRVLSVHALRAHGGSGMSKRLLVSAHGCSWP